MADNDRVEDHNGQKIERRVDRAYASRFREQRAVPRGRDKAVDLPAPPPDPWASPWCVQNARNQAETTQTRGMDEDEDIIAYLTDLGTPPLESQASECPSRNSATSTMAMSNVCNEDAFEHLDRLYAFTEQILELRSRSSKFFKRVRNLEKLKVLRNADRRLENAFARDKDAMSDICEEDTGFAESLLDAMLSNCRDPTFQRRYTRSSSSRQTRSKNDVEKQTSRDEISGSAPKVSKWTRVKAAFKWERACTNDVEAMDTSGSSTTTGLSTPTTKYHRSQDTDTGDTNSFTVSSYGNETSDVGTPFGRTSSASSSNEGSYDCSQRNVSNHVGYQSLKIKNDKKTECTGRRCQSLDDDIVALDTERVNNLMNEVGQGKPLIRVTSEKNHTMHSLNRTDEKDPDLSSKRFTPTLTITIPSHEDEFRCMSSPDSSSPLPSSAHTSGGNSPQHRKMHRELSSNKDFKRQQSVSEESTMQTSKMQRQDSKWNKVRRAFLTNSALSVPPNLIRVVSRQMILQEGLEGQLAYGDSVEDLRKTPLNAQAETRRDYRALREKLGSEFHRKLVEWERLKNLSPRCTPKDTRELSSGQLNPREGLPSEEKLAPEFRKKLQDWKRTKKDRRGSAPFEQQRINRRRLTDWQLWRSPSKTEYRSKENASSRGSCEENVGEGRSHLGEDFVRKMEAWRRMNEASSREGRQSMHAKSHRLGISSGVDESEFLALERVLSLFYNGTGRGRRESDARQLDECFDGDARPNVDGAQNTNYTNEVLIRTSVGSYRFEGISREFTRKLYDWERYRGISPTSSTFRLLGPAYDPFARDSTVETSTIAPPTTKSGSDVPVLFKINALKRSKSAGSVIDESIQDEFFIRRSTSLQSFGHCKNRLKDSERIDTSPTSIDTRRTEDITEDIVMDDSEPEAMIVDIEDVIEETASPLKRVQPHQTPVYSVAASETTSIAVPLGTVTSSHEPSPVFLIEIEENEDRKHWESQKWNRKKSFSSEDSLDSERWSATESPNKRRYCTKDSDDKLDGDLDKDSINSDSSIYSMELNRKVVKESKEMAHENRTDFERKKVPILSPNGKDTIETVMKECGPDGINGNETNDGRNPGNHSTFSASMKQMMDLPSEKKHEQEGDAQGAENDRSSDDGKDVTKAKMICDNEYEEIIVGANDPRCCSLADTQPMTNCNEGNAKTLSESSSNCKLDDTKFTICGMSSRLANREEHFKRHEENYGVIRDELHNRHTCNAYKTKSCNEYSDREKHNSCAKGISAATECAKTRERYYGNFENVSPSLMLRTVNSNNGDYHPEPTIRTTPCTVAPCREERCLERIIINEETLNKIVVPTASTGCTDKSKSSKQSPRDSNEESSEDRRSSSDRSSSINRETTTKKQNSPTRNVFIKTKRIIFSPFRRTDEHSAGKKDSPEDDRVFPLKSKSKSRSASPKINRQDALLRMSLSLPWPLRPSSKDRELKEPKIEENSKEESSSVEIETQERDKSAENAKRLSISEKSETQAKYETQISRERNSSIESTKSNELKRSLDRENQRVSVSVQATSDQQQRQTISAIDSSSLKNEEQQNERSSLKFDSQSSDLIHKLNILSNAVARRDGRTNTISEESSLESHSLRVRRAKEDFLSRRGGPLCHSVLEPSSKDYGFPKPSAHHYERILDNQQKIKEEKTADVNRVLKLEEARNTGEAQEKETKGNGMGLFMNEYDVNELSGTSVVSRPDRVKSASAGMINVDPDTFVRLTESNRGCESLPRSISKQQEAAGRLAKIVNKFKFSRLIRGKDIEEGNMSTISKLCRQSLLIDVRNDFESTWEANDRKEISAGNVDKIKKEE